MCFKDWFPNLSWSLYQRPRGAGHAETIRGATRLVPGAVPVNQFQQSNAVNLFELLH